MKKPSPSILVSSAALVVALGGTSYAAVQVTGKDIKNNTVTSADIKNKTIKAKDIAKGTIKAKNIKPGVIPTGARWALVNAAGQIEAQSGGFNVVSAYPTLPNTAAAGAPDNSLRANGNVYINTNEPLGNNGILATVALQNTNPAGPGRNAGPDANPTFSGEIAVSQCGTAITACAPPGTATDSVFVVSPRLSDGQPTGVGGANDRKRFYVVVVGDSSDYVGPKL